MHVRVAAGALAVWLVVGCGVGDFPSSVVVDGTTFLVAGGTEYQVEAAQLTPQGTADSIDVPGADGTIVFALAGVDPSEALILPAVPGFEVSYFLLLPRETVQTRSVDDDFGIVGLCRYRVERQAGCT